MQIGSGGAMRGTTVPVTGAVLKWAIDKSGYSTEELCARLKIEPATLQAWIDETEQPGLTKFKDLAAQLHRPPAILLLAEPPRAEARKIEFRHPITRTREFLRENELSKIREVRRLQGTLSWTRRELGVQKPEIPVFSSASDPESAAESMRKKLGIDHATQVAFQSDSIAVKAWRAALEGLGVLAFQLPLGADGVRGFSLWDEYAPAVVFSSAWPETVRVFSMHHELGHLLTRSDSACHDIGRAQIRTKAEDEHERWCDRFAAAVLLPWSLVQATIRSELGGNTVRIQDYGQARTLARKLNVSVTATILRLIDRGVARWDLYESIPRNIEEKKRGGGGGGRNRLEIRRDEYGQAVAAGFVAALKEELITRDDAMGYLKISHTDLRAVEAAGGKFA